MFTRFSDSCSLTMTITYIYNKYIVRVYYICDCIYIACYYIQIDSILCDKYKRSNLLKLYKYTSLIGLQILYPLHIHCVYILVHIKMDA